MKKAIMAAALLLGATLTSTPADRRNFWLLNNTGHAIRGVFLAPHGTDAPWSSDILGDDTLGSGVGTVVYFFDNSTRCVYDFRITYSNGEHEDYLQGRNLCQYRAVQFNGGENVAF